MKALFFDEWKEKRLQKIYNIFGKSWFHDKKVLELAACHGDIGIDLIRHGADVTFADARKQHLDGIIEHLTQYQYNPKTVLINQNNFYNLNQQFDLVLHMGVLYHIENWIEDLECALRHSNKMILETAVTPYQNSPAVPFPSIMKDDYSSVTDNQSRFTQEAVEQVLERLNCKFIRFDDTELNTGCCYTNENVKIQHIYDWHYHSNFHYDNKAKNLLTHYRRMWLVLR